MFKSMDIGIDLGTANILVFVKGKGVVLKEPSVVAIDKVRNKVLAVGDAAREMLGRSPGTIVAIRPLKEGVIANYTVTQKLLSYVIEKVAGKSLFFKPRVMTCVPIGITSVEKRAVMEATTQGGASKTYLIEEPLAAALGANLPIQNANGHMLVDIGGGTTDVAVLSLNGVANSSSVEVAGDAFDEAIARYVRRKHGVVIGQVTAEDIKIQIGCVYPRPEDTSMSVKGRDAKTGLPRVLTLFSTEIYEVLRRPARQIADEVLSVLEETSPELVGDISKNGITLTGGGCQIWGMDKLLTERTGITCTMADDPASCVVYGCGKSLGWINHMQEGPINLARKRIMRE